MKRLLFMAMVVCTTTRLGQYVVTNCPGVGQGWGSRNSSGDWIERWDSYGAGSVPQYEDRGDPALDSLMRDVFGPSHGGDDE